MANKKVFTDESLGTLISEIKSYTDAAVEDIDSLYVGDDVVESTVPINADTLNGYTAEDLINMGTGGGGGGGSVFVDAELSTTSENPVQNKVITAALAENVDELKAYADNAVDNVTKAQLGLGNVDNTSDMDKPVSTAQQEAIDLAISALDEGVSNVILQMYGADLTEDGAPTIRDIANDEATDALAEAKAYTDTVSSGKAAKATTLSGYGITDAYTKTEVDTAIENTKIFFVEVNKDSGVLASNKSSSEITQAFENGMTVVCLYRLNLGDIPTPLQLSVCQGDIVAFSGVYGNYIETVTITGTNATTETIDNTVLHEHLANTSNPHGVTKAQVGLENVDNTSDMNKPVSNAQQQAITSAVEELGGAFDEVIYYMYGDDITEDGIPTIRDIANDSSNTALTEAKTYTNTKIDALVGTGASTTLDTIGEISAAIEENQDMLDTLNSAIGNKVDKVSGKGLSTNDLTATLKSNYDAAYSHVSNKSNPHGVTLSQLGVSATADELNYVDGVTSNVQTQLDAKAKATDLTSHTGNTSNPHGVTAAQVGAYTKSEVDTKLSGKANTSHGNHVPTTETANNAKFLRNDNTWATVTPANIGAAASSHNHTVANITDLTATATELNYMDGVTSNVQTQLDGKAASSHTHTKSQITDFPTSLKNPNSLTIQGNGTTLTNGVYDGSAAKTVNITPSAIGAAESSHTHSSYVNQNAFSNVTVGSTTIAADSATDTLTLVAGSNITLTPDATNDKITIAATDTVYTHPSSHPASMITGLATVATSGSYNDLSNKPTIPAAYSLPTASSSTLGGVKTTSTVTSTSGLTACPIISGVPYYKDTNNTYTLSSFGVNATSTELNYCDGVTSNIQTQLNGKSNSGHGHSASEITFTNEIIKPYAIDLGGSSSHGGYIDFHYNNEGSDYTTRIIEMGRGKLGFHKDGDSTQYRILTSLDVIVTKNTVLQFSGGVATYSDSRITANSVCFAQRFTGSAGNVLGFTTECSSGKVTIATDSHVNVQIGVNLLIFTHM